MRGVWQGGGPVERGRHSLHPVCSCPVIQLVSDASPFFTSRAGSAASLRSTRATTACCSRRSWREITASRARTGTASRIRRRWDRSLFVRLSSSSSLDIGVVLTVSVLLSLPTCLLPCGVSELTSHACLMSYVRHVGSCSQAADCQPRQAAHGRPGPRAPLDCRMFSLLLSLFMPCGPQLHPFYDLLLSLFRLFCSNSFVLPSVPLFFSFSQSVGL